MASTLPSTAHRHLHRLFAQGTCAGLTDAQLLERFAASRDGRAFEALVIRHGPMVLTVGRAILGNRDDAEDAFQATFLILARRAGSIRGQASLGPWLHRVASRVAIQAHAKDRRQRQSECRAGAARASALLPSHEAQFDLRGAVHEEIARLPEHWRRPVVLCDLEGKTHAQAAAELRWGEATVRRRLAAARNRLRSRLVRQGVAPLAVVPGILDPRNVHAAVPEAWVAAATRAAIGLGIGRGSRLAASVLNRMALGTVKTTAAAGLVVLVLAGLGIAVLAIGAESDAPPPPAPKADQPRSRPPEAKAATAPPQDDTTTVRFQGRVLDPDGRPRAGAQLYLQGEPPEGYGLFPTSLPLRTTSGQDGRFRFELSQKELASLGSTIRPVVLGALAPGSGPAWVELKLRPGQEQTQTLTLTRDDVPLTGRVLDRGGQPIAGASVTVFGLYAIPGNDVPAWLRALREAQGQARLASFLDRTLQEVFRVGTSIPTVRTQSDGRFQVKGIGRDRLASLIISGPGIGTEWRVALTSRLAHTEDLFLWGERSEANRLRTPDFDVVTSPARSIEGTVKDSESGEPLEGIRIRDDDHRVIAITDHQGRYTLSDDKNYHHLQFTADPSARPYVTTGRIIPRSPRSEKLTVDASLKRGVWIEGQVTDRATGERIMADVAFFPVDDGRPHRNGATTESETETDARVATDANGQYRIAGAPGRGVLAVQARSPNRYLAATALESAVEDRLRLVFYYQLRKDRYHRLDVVDLHPGPGTFAHDFPLEPGQRQKGHVIGPDGNPVTGVTVIGMHNYGSKTWTLEKAEFAYVHLRPGTVDTLLFIQRTSRLGGSLDVTGNEPGPLRVSLAPTGTVVGRLVNAEGRPRPNVGLLASPRRKKQGISVLERNLNGRTTTDAEGRFQLEDIIPEVEYELGVLNKDGSVPSGKGLVSGGWSVRSGETKDWGDVQELIPKKD